ncbi:S-layer homology domain-containing protein [Anaerovorax sp. IOR16]|uniref:S-layer homology domain-containing protein n=1 Tax=Anaerovorax sp. IOR16 TaxID=2773458 RepID=UPI0019CF6B71|nr:S-layer homology domain-containing protein [Anaerovorax sp. IOR16]
MNKTIVITLAAIMIFASTATYAADQQYKDLKTTNWAYESVKAMSDKDIIKGYPDKSFRPQNTVTYGEFIKMMVVATKDKDYELTVAEKPHHWAYNYYQKALELKLFEEADIDKSMLNQPIPRNYMALIISNALGKTDIENYTEIEESVKDVDSKTKYDYHIIKSYATGILSGYTDRTFKPDGTLNRAESALVIYRFTEPEKRTPVTAESLKKDNAQEQRKITIVTIDEGWTKYTLNSTDVQLGYNGIEKIEVNSIGRIVIYSTVCYDAINIYLDNTLVDSMCFTNGLNYYLEDGYYIYLANPSRKNIITKGKIPSLLFSDDNVYRYTDVIL